MPRTYQVPPRPQERPGGVAPGVRPPDAAQTYRLRRTESAPAPAGRLAASSTPHNHEEGHQ